MKTTQTECPKCHIEMQVNTDINIKKDVLCSHCKDKTKSEFIDGYLGNRFSEIAYRE